jgi:hypothetical protein
MNHTFIVVTDRDTTLTRNGMKWNGVVGPNGYEAKLFLTRVGAERAAAKHLNAHVKVFRS